LLAFSDASAAEKAGYRVRKHFGPHAESADAGTGTHGD